MGTGNIFRLVFQVKLTDLLLSEARIAQLGMRRLWRMINHARTHSPFYREYYRNLPPQGFTLDQVPPVDKNILMDNFEDLPVVRGISKQEVVDFAGDPNNIGKLFRGQYILTHTSGTSGFQGYYLYDQKGWDTIHSLYLARAPEGMPMYHAPYRMIKKYRYAVVIPVGGHYATLLTSEIAPKSKALFFKTHMLSIMLPIEEMVDTLNKLNPEILHIYPSSLSVMIQEAAGGRLRIKPRIISSASEYLASHVRERAEQVFDATITQRYGTTECVMIGSTCEHGRLHLSHDWVVLENMDENDQPVQVGEAGHHVLITCLYNHLQPLIRYRLDDSLRFYEDPCPCGSKLPSFEVEGRSYPNYILKGAHQPLVEIAPVSFQVVLIQFKQVLTFQMIRESTERIRLKLVFLPNTGNIDFEVARAVGETTQYMRSQGVHESVEIIPEVCDTIPPDPKSGKLRLFVTEG